MSAGAVSKGPVVEAVIISGPRKGEFVRLDGDDFDDPAVEHALEQALEEANRLADNARAMREETEAFLAELRERRRERESA
jgi:hypothetical protein